MSHKKKIMLRQYCLSTPCSIAIALLLALSVGERASAGIISEVIPPKATAGFIHANYDATTDLLELEGWTLTFDDLAGDLNSVRLGANTVDPNAPGTFTLDATFDSAGNFDGGTFEVAGTRGNSNVRVTLLKGTLFQANSALLGSGVLEFKADPASLEGAAASLFGTYDEPPFGIRVRQLGSGFSFAQSFEYAPLWDGAVADIGRAVPEPSSMAVFASCLAFGCCGRMRRRKRNC